MNFEYYQEFLMCQSKGLKQQSKDALERFICSFSDFSEKQTWVTENLSDLEVHSNGRLRNELFEELVFPVLADGYKNKQVHLMIWLVKFSKNLYQNQPLWHKIHGVTPYEIIRECYDLEPENTEIRDLCLQLGLEGIQYAIHEWPCGILLGPDGATKEACQAELVNVNFLRTLDHSGKYESQLADYENKLHEYMKR